jgi:hypothetical protein
MAERNKIIKPELSKGVAVLRVSRMPGRKMLARSKEAPLVSGTGQLSHRLNLEPSPSRPKARGHPSR